MEITSPGLRIRGYHDNLSWLPMTIGAPRLRQTETSRKRAIFCLCTGLTIRLILTKR